MKNERLNGKTVVITGASGGLGEQMAYLCAESGANLFLLARNRAKLDSIAARIRDRYHVECRPMEFDASQHEQIPAAFSRIFDQAGNIDVLVNNAGYGIFAEAGDADMKDVHGMFAVNVIGLIACTREVIPFMRARRSGHIINVASQAGKLATPKSSVYSATKHAVLGYTNSLRMEMAEHGVFVTAVNPGPIATNFFQTADPGG
ncbi:MAG TPA: SDR family oxidoreductase, partial [Bacillaceae bacterium]